MKNSNYSLFIESSKDFFKILKYFQLTLSFENMTLNKHFLIISHNNLKDKISNLTKIS